MKGFSILLLVFVLSVSAEAQKYFKIIDATSQGYSGGMPQNGSGVVYVVKAVLLTNQKVTFNDIWINKEYGVPETLSQSYSDGRKLVKGDTVLIRYTIHYYPANSPLNNVAKPTYKNPPIPIQGEALLGFTAGKSTRYRSVEKFKALPAIAYP